MAVVLPAAAPFLGQRLVAVVTVIVLPQQFRQGRGLAVQVIEAAAGDWVLLFQMGTVEDEDFELMWGDCGCIYFWIKKQDLAAGNFDRVWLILQCG